MERVELYCAANDVKEEKKVSVLLILIGAKTYNLLRNCFHCSSGKSVAGVLGVVFDVE